MTTLQFAPCLELPPNPSGGKLYRDGSSIARVFLLLARPNGATMGELRKLVATFDKPGVCLFPLTKHADSRGRNGVRWDLRIDGKPVSAQTESTLKSLSDSARVEIGNVRASDVVVNTRYHRSAPATIADFIDRVNRASVPPAANPSTNVEPTPATPATPAKSKRKRK